MFKPASEVFQTASYNVTIEVETKYRLNLIVFIFCLIFQQCACQPNIECHADGNRHAERGNGGRAADGEQGKGNGCRRGGKQHTA